MINLILPVRSRLARRISQRASHHLYIYHHLHPASWNKSSLIEIIISDRGRSTAERNNFIAPNMTQASDIKKEGVVIQTDAPDATAEFGRALLWFVKIVTIVLSHFRIVHVWLRNLRLYTLR